MFMKWDPGEILIILTHIKMSDNSLKQKVENSDKQHHGPVGPSNSRSCCTWQFDFWWPRLRPFEFAFRLSLNYNYKYNYNYTYNYNYQKYNSVSCTHMYTGWQWCKIKFIKYRRIQRFRKIMITPAPECYVATVVVAFLPKFPWSLQASRCYQLLKNWNPAPKLEHLVQKKDQFIHKISTTISQHNWPEIKETSQSSKAKEKKTRKQSKTCSTSTTYFPLTVSPRPQTLWLFARPPAGHKR